MTHHRTADSFFRRAHRVISFLFLLTVPPAMYASFTGNPALPSPLVYLPLLPLLGLMLSSGYL